MAAVMCNVAAWTMPTEWIAAALVIGSLAGVSVLHRERLFHWLRRHLTSEGRALGLRLRAITQTGRA